MIQTSLAVLIFIVGLTIYPQIAHAGELFSACKLSKAEKALDMDQRDKLRKQCLLKKINNLSVNSCFRVAKSFEFSNNSDYAKLACLVESRHIPTVKQCYKISSAIFEADIGDSARWTCIEEYSHFLKKKDCLKLAEKMAYPTNQRRALNICNDRR